MVMLALLCVLRHRSEQVFQRVLGRISDAHRKRVQISFCIVVTLPVVIAGTVGAVEHSQTLNSIMQLIVAIRGRQLFPQTTDLYARYSRLRS